MKVKANYKIASLGALLLAPVMWSSCSDTWDEHYDVQDGTMASYGSLYTSMSEDNDLTNFMRVVDECGASDMYSASQQYTVWAPVGLTSTQADSIISVYQTDEALGRDWDDNRAITQFIQNHTALYTHSVSSITNDTISMLNSKYMRLVGKSASTGSLQDEQFDGATLANNGMFYKLESPLPFSPNVREYVEMTSGLDSMLAFIESFDEYVLDENSSVAGGVEDGKTVYLDSVTYLNNDMLSRLGYIQREDSVYTLLALTNDVWKEQYDKYLQYYNYTSAVSNADSLANYNAHYNIVQGRFFNTSQNYKYNRSPQDSLCNTQYNVSQTHMPRKNVYYKPESSDGILNGLEKETCSNGVVYVDNKGVIPPSSTFFTRNDVPCYYSSYYTIPTNSSTNAETMNVSNASYEVYDTLTDELLHTYTYVQVTAKTSSDHTSLVYSIPDVLSNCYYNIYLVTIPNEDTNIPLWFQVSQTVAASNGQFPSTSTYFNNPHPITADSDVDNVDDILNQSNNSRCFVSTVEKIDTILLQSAVLYPYSSYSLSDPTVKLTIQSFGPSAGSKREKIYTRTLRLCELIFVPFETEEEALEAADDIDAFSDEKLQAIANQEN